MAHVTILNCKPHQRHQTQQTRNILDVRNFFLGGLDGSLQHNPICLFVFCFFPTLKLESKSFFACYGNHLWESSAHDHIKTETISERQRQRERGLFADIECIGENGQHATTSNQTSHITEMDKGSCRQEIIPSSFQITSFFFIQYTSFSYFS